MDSYVNSKIKNIILTEPDREYVRDVIIKFKKLSNNNPEALIREITQNKNSIESINKIFKDLDMILCSAKLDRESKRIIFYYTYYHDCFVRENELLNHKNKRKIYDVKLRKPNNYTGKVDDRDVYFKIVSNKDLIVSNYKIMEIYNIRMPYIDLNFKNIIVCDRNEKVNTPISENVFIQILMILRQFNSNGLFVYFDKWNIRRVGENYYLLNLEKIISRNIIDHKKQISLLTRYFNPELSFDKYKNNIEIYDQIVKTDFLIKSRNKTKAQN